MAVQKQAIQSTKSSSELPSIPNKLYFTIGEVSSLCDLKPHVLRYWEQEFPQLNPVKRRGNRRYYKHKDVVLVRQIRELLYDRGFKIDGARAKLTGAKQDADVNSGRARHYLQQTIAELESILSELES